MASLKELYEEWKKELQQNCNNEDWMKSGGWFCGILLPSAKCSRPPGRRENSLWKTIWRTTQRPNSSFWSNGWISPDFNTRPVKTSSIWQESSTWYLSWVWIENQCERGIDITKGRIIHIPNSRWYSKIVRKRLRFPRTHSKAGQTVRSEDLSGELHGETGELQPTESKDRWSPERLLGDSGWLHLSSSQWTSSSTLFAEETFLVPLRYIDVTRATFTNLDVMQEKHVDDYWNVHSNRSLSDSRKGFTKFTRLKEKPPKGYTWSWWDWQKFKRLPDQIMYGQKYGPKWVKPLRLEKATRMEKREAQTRQALQLRGIYFTDLDDQDCKSTLKTARRKLERLVAAAMPCKRKARTSTTKVAANEELASQKIPQTICGWKVSLIHKATSGITKHEDRIAGKGFTSMTHSICFTNLFLCLK